MVCFVAARYGLARGADVCKILGKIPGFLLHQARWPPVLALVSLFLHRCLGVLCDKFKFWRFWKAQIASNDNQTLQWRPTPQPQTDLQPEAHP